jgi:hypothetical protein
MNRSWYTGVAIIIVGLIFLLNRTGGYPAGGRWWALFLVLAAVPLLERAWRRSRAGEPPARIASLVSSALLVLAVAGVFFFGVPWGRAWPIFVIIAGVATLFRTRQ